MSQQDEIFEQYLAASMASLYLGKNSQEATNKKIEAETNIRDTSNNQSPIKPTLSDKETKNNVENKLRHELADVFANDEQIDECMDHFSNTYGNALNAINSIANNAYDDTNPLFTLSPSIFDDNETPEQRQSRGLQL